MQDKTDEFLLETFCTEQHPSGQIKGSPSLNGMGGRREERFKGNWTFLGGFTEGGY